MVKQHRSKLSRILYTIPGVTTEAYPITQTPLVPLVFGTTTQPQSAKALSTVSTLPQNIIENIIDHLHDRPADLQTCCFVSKNWRARSQSHLFRRVRWTTETVSRWCKHIPPHPDGPASLVTSLLVVSLLEHDRLDSIKAHFTSFRNVTSLTLRDLSFDDPLFDPDQVPIFFGHFKSGLKSLTLINANGSCGKLLSFASSFPRVEYLTISRPGDLVPPDPVISLGYQPLRGTLFLQGHLNRHADFIKLLSRIPPPRCRTIRLEHWGKMHVDDFDSLLKSCSESLETLDVSACKGQHSISVAGFHECSNRDCYWRRRRAVFKAPTQFQPLSTFDRVPDRTPTHRRQSTKHNQHAFDLSNRLVTDHICCLQKGGTGGRDLVREKLVGN